MGDMDQLRSNTILADVNGGAGLKVNRLRADSGNLFQDSRNCLDGARICLLIRKAHAGVESGDLVAAIRLDGDTNQRETAYVIK